MEIPIGIKRLAIGATLFAGACADLGTTSSSEVRSVVWIEVDTLRADALGCYGSAARGEAGELPSPVIDGLAAEGVLFERAYSAAPWTVPSFVTQLTGEWPFEHGAIRLLRPIANDGPTLPEFFRQAGWRTACVMTNYVVQEKLGFDRGFEIWDESLSEAGPEGSTGEAAAHRLLEVTDQLLERPGEGLFLLLFLFEPHWRYELQPGLGFGGEPGELASNESLPELRARRDELSDSEIARLRRLYQSEVAGVDRAIGVFLDGLSELELLDEALVVFTADHGEEVMDRGWIGHTRSLYDELVRVPLIVRLPGSLPSNRLGVRIDSAVSQIDLGATILELMGVSGELGESRSFADTVLTGDRPARRYLYLHTDFDPPLRSPANLEKVARQWGVVDALENEKWIVDRHPDREAGGEPATEWFSLEEDPLERLDLSESQPIPDRFFTLPALDPSVPSAELALDPTAHDSRDE